MLLIENRRKTKTVFKPAAILDYNMAKTCTDVSDKKKPTETHLVEVSSGTHRRR